MDEFIRELEEDLQREKWRKVWKQYGPTLIGLSAAIILGTAIGTGWKSYNASQQRNATAELMHILEEAKTDPATGMEKVKIFAEKSRGHAAAIAWLHYGGYHMAQNHPKEAADAYLRAAADTKADEALRNLARAQAMQAQLNDGKTVSPISISPSEAFYGTQKELNGWALLVQDKKAEAAETFSTLGSEEAAPSGMRTRASIVGASLAEKE